jgi:hypothetical protein
VTQGVDDGPAEDVDREIPKNLLIAVHQNHMKLAEPVDLILFVPIQLLKHFLVLLGTEEVLRLVAEVHSRPSKSGKIWSDGKARMTSVCESVMIWLVGSRSFDLAAQTVLMPFFLGDRLPDVHLNLSEVPRLGITRQLRAEEFDDLGPVRHRKVDQK